ncbi:hypothetical protein VTI28DRAFT_6293 [Corynascus sepedonium]
MDTIVGATNLSGTQVDDPSLRTIILGVPEDIAIDAPVPEVRATAEERFKDFDINSITHVVIQVTVPRQTEIFRYIGYQYDWDWPGPFWHFLGKIVDKTLFDNKAELRELNFVALGRREFIAYTTSMWTAAVEAEKAAGMAKLPTLSAIEVNFKKPQPGQPLEMIWAPARGLITAKIRQWNESSDDDEPYIPEGKD